MRKIFKLFFIFFVFSLTSYADASPEKKIISIPNADGVTKINVEGATFKNFNLFVQFTPHSKLIEADKKLFDEIKNIITNDLKIVSGIDFIKVDESKKLTDDFLKQSGAEGKSIITVNFVKTDIIIQVKNTNYVLAKAFEHTIKADRKAIRKLAHSISKVLYENFVGPEDIFLRPIAAVERINGNQQVVVMDFDGANKKVITNDKWVKVSPYFSPDSKSILYGVITPTGHGIVEHTLSTGKKVFLTKKVGINIEPVITKDNKCLFMTLSYEKKSNIYRANRNGTIVGPLMDSTLGENLSLNISGDQKTAAFVSNRSGKPQIYTIDLNSNCTTSGIAKRITFQGDYNQKPGLNRDGSIMVFTARDEKNVFDIFVINIPLNKIARVTQNQGHNKSAVISDSGRYVYFTSDRNGKDNIYLSNLAGTKQFAITSNGNYDSLNIGPAQ